ncbi:hypothetical protein [Klebsiella oxytoca]|uniref:Uncharacterized protein n=1 Tax=Klebsiella oxytoca TaxID=571 RepID=A0A6B8MTY4_KLEOX|nr:hypothetical protein [Klebsiella oxytoca]QGN37833.1 hypothetical protein GJ746_11200 [Klebsiella oxytoca]
MGNIARLTGANHERRISEPVSVGSRILYLQLPFNRYCSVPDYVLAG